MTNAFRLLIVLIILPILVLFSGCKKSEADFTTDKDSYMVGETIEITCTSKNVRSAYFQLPDGSTIKGKTASYVVPPRSPESISVTLYVGSRMGKISHCTKEISIVDGTPPPGPTGTVTLWASWTAGSNLNIYAELIGGNKFYDGLITNTQGLDPGCLSSDALHMVIEQGTYHFWADSPFSPNVWSRDITVTANTCISVKVTPVF